MIIMSEQEIKQIVTLEYDGKRSSTSILVEDRTENMTITKAIEALKEQSEKSPYQPEYLQEMIDARECRAFGKQIGKDTLLKSLPFDEREERYTGRKALVANLEFFP